MRSPSLGSESESGCNGEWVDRALRGGRARMPETIRPATNSCAGWSVACESRTTEGNRSRICRSRGTGASARDEVAANAVAAMARATSEATLVCLGIKFSANPSGIGIFIFRPRLRVETFELFGGILLLSGRSSPIRNRCGTPQTSRIELCGSGGVMTANGPQRARARGHARIGPDACSASALSSPVSMHAIHGWASGGRGVERAGGGWRACSPHRIQNRTNYPLLGDEGDDLHRSPATGTDKRVDLVDVADQVCPALSRGLALGGVGLFRDRSRRGSRGPPSPPASVGDPPSAAASRSRLARAALAYLP